MRSGRRSSAKGATTLRRCAACGTRRRTSATAARGHSRRRSAAPIPARPPSTRQRTPPGRRPFRQTSRRRCWRFSARSERAAAVYQPPPDGLDEPLSSPLSAFLSPFFSFLADLSDLLSPAGGLSSAFTGRETRNEPARIVARINFMEASLLGVDEQALVNHFDRAR